MKTKLKLALIYAIVAGFSLTLAVSCGNKKISGHKSARRQRCNKAQNRHRKTCQQPRRAVFVFSPIHRNRKMRPFAPWFKGNTRRMAVQYKEVGFVA